MTVSGDYVYVADGAEGLRVISVSDPAQPVEAGNYYTSGTCRGVAVSGDYAYVANYTAGLQVISVADAGNPVEVGYHDTPGTANGMAVSGDYAYVADVATGLQIYQFYSSGVEDKPGAEVRSTNAPTLVRGVLRVADGSNASSSPSWLLDACGRNVMELLPGANDVSRLGPGVYFVRSVGRELSAGCQKVVLTR